jgi:UDP-N-acetylmuramate--alanine ligase
MTERFRLPESLLGFRVHLVGIKGTGMAALAEILTARGARVSGSDTAEKFTTDEVLRRLSIPFVECFREENLPPDTQLVIHSAAYRRDENPELIAAVRRAVPLVNYPEALGLLSRRSDSSGISGVHGKSTTTAMCGAIIKEWGFPATVLVGAEVPAFGDRSTIVQGDRLLVAETCEYRRHFLNFHPSRVVITSVEPDHLDYFIDLEDMLSAFEAYGLLLPPGGTLIYCHDDPGAREAAARIGSRRGDVVMAPYGRTAPGPLRITAEESGEGKSSFTLAGMETRFTLRVPGAHNVLNAAAAVGLCASLWAGQKGKDTPVDLEGVARALAGFSGSRRRSEIVGEAGGILVIDDYGHHPTAIAKTLDGLRTFYPGRRLVVDFMSHTYSRTQALLSEFGTCFSAADLVILHRIYASAREKNEAGITGRALFTEVSRHHSRAQYFEDPLDALPYLASELKRGDIFITMGAGDNWKLGRQLLAARGGTR